MPPEERPDLSTVIEQELAASFDGDTGDNPTANEERDAPPETPAPSHREQRAESGEPEQSDDEDWFSLPEEPAPAPAEELFRWDEIPDDPAMQKLAKGLQGTFTKKQQELAEQRKQLEAERLELARYREYEDRKRQDPAAAAQMLEAELKALGQGRSADPVQGVPADPVGSLLQNLTQAELTPEEQALTQVIQGLYQQNLSIQQQQQLLKQQQELEKHQREQADASRQIEGEKAALEAKLGRKIPDGRDAEVRRYAVDNGIPSYNAAFWALFGPQMIEHAKQEGAKRAEQTLSRKSLQSAMPPGAPPRRESGEPRPPRDIRGNVFAALDEAGIS